MLFRVLSILLSLLVLNGCQSVPQKKTIPEGNLDYLANSWVVAEACYSSGDYDIGQAVKYREAINHALSGWSVPKADLDRVIGEKRQQASYYQTAHGGMGTTCTDWRLNMETLVKESDHRKEQMKLIQQQRYEMNKARASNSSNSVSSSNEMIQCSRLGDFSLYKNIQTFKGSVCPIGWVDASGW